MPYLTIKNESTDTTLFYEDAGDPTGEPVVLIHGWPLSHRMWEYQVEALVDAGKRVISYDRRGFGESSKPWTGYDYDTMSDDLEGLLRGLELTNVTLVGFSMGGGEVARYLGRHGSERIKGAVFVSSIAPYLLKDDSNPEGVDQEVFDEMLQGVTEDRNAFLAQFGRQFTNADDLDVSDELLDYTRQIANFASPRATRECISAFATTDLRDDLRSTDVPVLVVHGKADQVVPFEVSGKRVPEFAPQATVEALDDAPHGLNYTHTEQLNELLVKFVS